MRDGAVWGVDSISKGDKSPVGSLLGKPLPAILVFRGAVMEKDLPLKGSLHFAAWSSFSRHSLSKIRQLIS